MICWLQIMMPKFIVLFCIHPENLQINSRFLMSSHCWQRYTTSLRNSDSNCYQGSWKSCGLQSSYTRISHKANTSGWWRQNSPQKLQKLILNFPLITFLRIWGQLMIDALEKFGNCYRKMRFLFTIKAKFSRTSIARSLCATAKHYSFGTSNVIIAAPVDTIFPLL